VLAVTIGIQTVGVVLMAALLITPSAAARAWTKSLPSMLLIAALIAAVSAATGTLISSSIAKMPTGPWVVLVLGALGFGSLLFAPEKGLLFKRRRAREHRAKTLRENLLKLLYSQEERQEKRVKLSKAGIMQIRPMREEDVKRGLRDLKKRLWIVERRESKAPSYSLTDLGRVEGRRVVRLHRLWELYLTERLGMAADHIHPQAETMEHVITPEIESLLIKELGTPERDPHQSVIPYENK